MLASAWQLGSPSNARVGETPAPLAIRGPSEKELRVGTSTRDYVWMDGIPVANVDTTGTTSTIAYVTADQLGTPRAIADSSGTTVWQWAYQSNAWGEAAPTGTGYVYNLRFPGQYADAETGLSYNVNRDYDSDTGRYMQSDPLGLKGGQLNTYAYVGNNPLEFIDQLGLYDFYVTVWNGNYLAGEVGHVGTFTGDGTRLTSQFPDQHRAWGDNTSPDWPTTVNLEDGRQPDEVYKVHVPDNREGAIKNAAQNARSAKQWFFVPVKHNQTNCVDAALGVMNAAGFPIELMNGPILTPNEMNDAMEQMAALSLLANSPSASITQVSHVPW
ncbi:RHS repeat-associated core domain-containing protein [Dyella agri]|uniref:RHS repeat-associated core domain-containing protein n=1 Tax=Dyella agri TaxID=1926869 RepID=UPI00384D0F83